MKLRLPSEFLYQVFALLFAVILVHAAYVGVIRPSADSQLRFKRRSRRLEKRLPAIDHWPSSSRITSRKPASF